MVNAGRLLSIATRLVPAMIFVDLLRSLVVETPLILEYFTYLAAILGVMPSPQPLHGVTLMLRPFLKLALGASAVLTVLLGSPAAYSLTLVLLVLSWIPPSSAVLLYRQGGLSILYIKNYLQQTSVSSVEVPWVSIVGLFLVLMLDNVATLYRPGGSRIGVGVRGISKSVAMFTVLLTPFLLLSIAIGSYFTGLVQLTRRLATTAAPVQLRPILGSYLVYLLLVAVALYILLRLADSVLSVITPFVVPSRRVSLDVLVRGADIDVAFSPLLISTVLGLSTLVFFSAVHTLLFGVLLKPILEVAVSKLGVVGEVATYLASVLVTVLLVWGVFRTEVVATPRIRTTVSAISILLLIYLSAVKISLDRGSGLLSSVLMPDLGGVLSMISESYLNYSQYFVSFLESLLRFLGVTP